MKRIFILLLTFTFIFHKSSDAALNGDSLLTYNLITCGEGQKPNSAVSRREYLETSIHELINMRTQIIADVKQNVHIRPTAVQVAEKNQILAQLATLYSGEALEVRVKIFLAHYTTDEQGLEEAMDKETSHVNEQLQLMNTLLRQMPADQLTQPAVVIAPAIDFNGFEDGNTNRMLVRASN